MKLGVRGKLFAVSLVVMLVVGLVSGLFLEDALEDWLESRIEDELSRSAKIARDLVEIAAPPPSIAAYDPIADRIGESSGARVTIIDSSGRVLGDSEVAASALGELDNHADRPEVRAALERDQGTSQRFSGTVNTDMIYFAVRYRKDRDTGVVRVAVPLAEVGQAVRNLRLVLLLAGLVGIALAVFMSGLASQLATRAIRRLVDGARDVARGDGARRLHVASSDELGRLAGSFNRVVEELDDTVTVMRDERDHLQTILESMSEGVISLDADQRITRANRAARELLALGDRPADRSLVEAVRVPALVELVSGDVRGGAATEFELPGPRRVQAHAAPLRTGGLVLVLRDVTRTRRLEQIRRDFVANVSHELRTPVSVIRANVETLAGGAIDDPEHAHEFLGAVSRNADRLSQLITDLLDLSRIEAGESRLDIEPAPVAATADRIVDNLRSRADDAGLELSAEVAGDLEVLADRRALEQILFNLVDNALKYADQGRVEIRAEHRGDRIRVEVADQGPGIESRHRDRIFERFYRAEPGRSRQMGGTGLGLSIVKHLTEAMGGGVGFEPKGGRGSIFWLTLPAADHRPVVAGPEPDDSPAAPRPPVSAKSAPVEIRRLGRGDDYQSQLRDLRGRLLLMAGRVEEMIDRSVRALVERDLDLARETIASDHKVNRAELENDELCLVVLANRRPDASDLRFITLALKMVTDLERIGDIAVNICERAIDLAGAPPLRPWTDIEKMAEIARSMVHDAIDAFVAGDVEKAQAVITRDNDVDELYTRSFRDLLATMNERPATIERGIHILSVAKWLERIADHSTNLAEQVVFMVKGRDIRHLGKLPGDRP